jgi:hypothetical protein
MGLHRYWNCIGIRPAVCKWFVKTFNPKLYDREAVFVEIAMIFWANKRLGKTDENFFKIIALRYELSREGIRRAMASIDRHHSWDILGPVLVLEVWNKKMLFPKRPHAKKPVKTMESITAYMIQIGMPLAKEYLDVKLRWPMMLLSIEEELGSQFESERSKLERQTTAPVTAY